MTEQHKNSFDDDDMRQVLAELDEMDDEAEEIMASARGKVSAIRKRQKNKIKMAKDELGIPTGVLKPLRKIRALERQMQKIADDVSDDLVEIYEDCTGQFSLFAPQDGAEQPIGETAAQASARRRKAAAQVADEAEQADGERVLSELVH